MGPSKLGTFRFHPRIQSRQTSPPGVSCVTEPAKPWTMASGEGPRQRSLTSRAGGICINVLLSLSFSSFSLNCCFSFSVSRSCLFSSSFLLLFSPFRFAFSLIFASFPPFLSFPFSFSFIFSSFPFSFFSFPFFSLIFYFPFSFSFTFFLVFSSFPFC